MRIAVFGSLATALTVSSALFLTSLVIGWPLEREGSTSREPGPSLVVDRQGQGRGLPYRNICLSNDSVATLFRWSPDQAKEGNYKVQVLRDNKLEAENTSPDLTAAVGPLESDQDYTYRIWSRDQHPAVWATGGFRTPACNLAYKGCPFGEPLISHGPIVGAVTQSSARIWVRACDEVTFQVAYKQTTQAWTQAQLTDFLMTIPSRDNTRSVDLAGLEPATQYDFRLVLFDSIVLLDVAGSFRTLPHPLQPSRVRFLVGADISQDQPDAIFGQAIKAKPDFALLIGDQIYADSFFFFPPTGKEAFEYIYKKQFSKPALRSFLAKVPTFMMWDDHEIQDNYDSGPTALYEAARAAYDEYQGSHNPDPLEAGGLYYTFRAGPADFFVLDTRSYRSRISEPDDEGKTMLGAEQKVRLKQWLVNSRAPFKFIVSSVPWIGFSWTQWLTNEVVKDHWDGYLTERDEIFDFVTGQGIRNVILLSGDMHATGVFRIAPWGLLEVSPTPLTQGASGDLPFPEDDPQVLFGLADTRVFGLIDVDTTVTPARVRVAVVDSTGATRYELSLTESEVGPGP